MGVYRFGEFSFDAVSGDLRRGRRLVRLRPQPAVVLEHFLKHPREVLSRDELCRIVWPEGVYVHFEHGLNSWIKQLRTALADLRSAPRYVETLPRRGYRFIHPVSLESVPDVYTDRDILDGMPKKAPDPLLPPHRFQILLALADQDLHGLGVMNDVLERTGGRMRLWPEMLYRNLDALVEEGLVAEVAAPPQLEAAGGRPRCFRITAAGRRACAAEAERLAAFVEVARQKRLLKT